jgi:hypothetical protein
VNEIKDAFLELVGQTASHSIGCYVNTVQEYHLDNLNFRQNNSDL